MRKGLLCLCCLGLVASFALADGELQTLTAGEQVVALKAARLGPDGMIGKWVDVGPGARGGERHLIFDCYEPDVDDCTGNGYWYPIGGASCGYGEPEDCDPATCSMRWFHGEDFCNMYTTNDMVFDSAYGGKKAKDIYVALYWYVNGPGSSESLALLIETYEEFDETCNVGDPGAPGFDNDTSDPGYIDGAVYTFGQHMGDPGGYTICRMEDLLPDVQLELPSDGAGSYNLWILTYEGWNPVWPDDFSLATCAQPMQWGTGDHEWIIEDTVNRGEGCTEHETMWYDIDGVAEFHDPDSEDCQDRAAGLCPDPVGAMICFCIGPGDGCEGDVDGDGDTDHSDLGALLGAWGSQPGDPNWLPGADLNGNGVVDHSDLGILLADWGCVP